MLGFWPTVNLPALPVRCVRPFPNPSDLSDARFIQRVKLKDCDGYNVFM